jgi:pheromone a factor receptor
VLSRSIQHPPCIFPLFHVACGSRGGLFCILLFVRFFHRARYVVPNLGFFPGLTLRSFWRRRLQFNELMSSNSTMNASRYLRLMLLALVDIMFTIPLGAYTMYIGNKGVRLAPWISWEDTHFNFARVAQIPTLLWRSDTSFTISVELTRWLPIFCAFVFFALFGFAAEATKHYALTFWWIAKPFGFSPSTSRSLKASLPG